jgi:hypothetical protein
VWGRRQPASAAGSIQALASREPRQELKSEAGARPTRAGCVTGRLMAVSFFLLFPGS